MMLAKQSNGRMARKGKQGTNHEVVRKGKQGSVERIEIVNPKGGDNESLESIIPKMEKLERFSFEDIKKFTVGFSEKLSSDGFGTVYKGQLPNSLKVAVSVLAEKDIAKEIFMAQVRAMAMTDHPNIVKLYGFCNDHNTKALVYEYVKHGSLGEFLYNKSQTIEWGQLYAIAVETAKGLSYLHDGCHQQIIHQDVKASNILLDSSLSPKISGFGLAMPMNRDVTHLDFTETRGSPTYAAPEMWMASLPVTYKCDVYSFGMLLFELLGRRNNMRDEEWFPKQVWDKFEKAQLDEIIQDCGIGNKDIKKAKILCKVALWCIQFRPQSRPTMSTVVEVLEKEIQVSIPPDPFQVSSAIMKKVFY